MIFFSQVALPPFFFYGFLSAEGILIEINWVEEFNKGGITSYVLAFLSIIAVASLIERFINLRTVNIAPTKFRRHLSAALKSKNPGALSEVIHNSTKSTSILSEAVFLIFEHSKQGYDRVNSLVSELLMRRFSLHQSRLQILGVVASLAPLLGLLGTMIGMIESFKLVSLYGEEGGAAILADSIAKALITTALGLIIAIPALGIYHFFKIRLQKLALEVEESVEEYLKFLYFKSDK